MAGGEVIVNGSVHWHVVHTDGTHAWKIGHRKDALSHEKGVLYGIDTAPTPRGARLRVTLRFETAQEARDAISNATVVENPESHLHEVVLDLKAVVQDDKIAEQSPPNPYAQVTYEYGPGGGGSSTSQRPTSI